MSELPGAGFLASARQLLTTLLETVQVRLDLLGTELGQEKRRAGPQTPALVAPVAFAKRLG